MDSAFGGGSDVCPSKASDEECNKRFGCKRNPKNSFPALNDYFGAAKQGTGEAASLDLKY